MKKLLLLLVLAVGFTSCDPGDTREDYLVDAEVEVFEDTSLDFTDIDSGKVTREEFGSVGTLEVKGQTFTYYKSRTHKKFFTIDYFKNEGSTSYITLSYKTVAGSFSHGAYKITGLGKIRKVGYYLPRTATTPAVCTLCELDTIEKVLDYFTKAPNSLFKK